MLASAIAAQADEISLVGYWEVGSCYGLDLQGGRTYHGDGSHLDVVDLTDPLAPVPLGNVQLPATVEDVAVVGAIAASGDHGYLYQMFENDLVAVDVSDPAAPQVVAEFARPGWYAHCLQADHGTIYANGLWVLKHEDLTGCQPPPPEAFCRLEPIWPNPCNPAANVAFSVPREQRVQIGVHSLDGRLIRELGDRLVAPGRHILSWAGTDARGCMLPSGVYLVRLATEGSVANRKVTLIR